MGSWVENEPIWTTIHLNVNCFYAACVLYVHAKSAAMLMEY